MPAATNKSDLLNTHVKEYEKLIEVLDSVSQNQVDLTLPGEDSSIRSIIHHRTVWMNMFINWYKDGADGKEVITPAKGYKWNQLKEYN